MVATGTTETGDKDKEKSKKENEKEKDKKKWVGGQSKEERKAGRGRCLLGAQPSIAMGLTVLSPRTQEA